MPANPNITREYLKALPERPGVYYMKDREGNIIYVGKAKRLKRRVSSYFRNGKHITKKIEKMVSQIHSIHIEETGSELEALLLEAREIKRLLPLFNRQIRNYKHYPFLKISTGTDYPRAYVVRQIAADHGTYYGPFPNSRMIEHSLQILNREFQLRVCTDKLGPGNHTRPCLYYDLHLCSAPCDETLISREEYQSRIQELLFFIEGKSNEVISRLEKEREHFSDNMEYEKAGETHKRILDISNLAASQQLLDKAVHEHHLIIKVPGKHPESSVLFAVVSGRFFSTLYVDNDTQNDDIRCFVDEAFVHYIDQHRKKEPIRKEEVDEMRIIAGWLRRNTEEGEWIEISQNRQLIHEKVHHLLNKKLPVQ